MITPNQIRAARGLLDWSQQDLAERAGVSKDSVKNIESGQTSPQMQTLARIKSAFEGVGIAFIEDEGVKRRKYEIRVLQGQQGFWDFYDDIYETIKANGGDILVHNVDESLFVKWLGERRWMHKDRMHKLDNFKQKIIIRDGDTNFAANYTTTEYRWAAKGEFSQIPFYLYGHKLAMVMFEEEDVSIYIIDQPKIAESYKVLFMSAWERAKIPPKPKDK
jgi:transcriptional regulator with XRE-family HTH domain